MDAEMLDAHQRLLRAIKGLLAAYEHWLRLHAAALNGEKQKG